MTEPFSIRIGPLVLGHLPRTAVPLSDLELASDGPRAAALADVIELRIDQFRTSEAAVVSQTCAAARRLERPLLGTVRDPAEGGATQLTPDRRLDLYEAILPHVDAVDVEWQASIRDSVVALARARGIPVILSHHDFQRTPPSDKLEDLVREARQAGADIVKVAVTAAGPADFDRLLHLLLAHRHEGFIAIAMGADGAATRVFFPLLGSLLTYGFLRRANAPGQLSLEDLVEELRRFSPGFADERAAREQIRPG